MDSESSAPSSPPPNPGTNQSKIPPDGCSLQSHGSSGAAQPGQPSPPSSGKQTKLFKMIFVHKKITTIKQHIFLFI